MDKKKNLGMSEQRQSTLEPWMREYLSVHDPDLPCKEEEDCYEKLVRFYGKMNVSYVIHWNNSTKDNAKRYKADRITYFLYAKCCPVCGEKMREKKHCHSYS